MPEHIDTETPYSPGWWLQTLATQLHNRRVGRDGGQRFRRDGFAPSRVRPGLELLDDYLRGDPPLRQDIHADWAGPFRQFLRMGRMNIAPRLVASTSNRLGLRDFRTAAASDELGDTEARAIMRRNKLRMKAREVTDHALGLGAAYTIVTPPDAERSWSLITAESPMQCITAHDPATGRTLAGLKMFRDDWDTTDFAYLFLPGELWVAKADVRASTLFTRGRRGFVLSRQWEWDVEKFDDVPNGRVAMVRFENKNGLSEIEGHLDTLDRINDKLFNEWWIGKIQAFRQRAIEMPDVDEDVDGAAPGDAGADVEELTDEEWSEVFTSAPDAMWRLPKGAKIWESTPADLNQLINSIKAELQWLAFTAAKPMHLITPDAANGSAEGASTQKEEHTFEILDRRDRLEASFAETMSMAFEFQGLTDRSDVSQIEAIWGPTELLSWEQRSSASSQLKGTLPREAIQTDVLQYTPGEVIDRLRPMAAADLLYGQGAAGGE